mmetsp:Transcript_22499/g.42689  ORF Transcript_22499/g.42689 Transcript_22499/m.42689 type:complete len:87 (+) Transcript_22499:380-640(+)
MEYNLTRILDTPKIRVMADHVNLGRSSCSTMAFMSCAHKQDRTSRLEIIEFVGQQKGQTQDCRLGPCLTCKVALVPFLDQAALNCK